MNSTKRIFILFISLACGLVARAQLSSGEIMFVGFNADGTDGIAIVALVDIPANTTIYFVDNEWNGSAIGSGGAFIDTNETEMTWDSGTSIITAGTVVTFTNTSGTPTVSAGSASGRLDPSGLDEVIYAFLGSDNSSPTEFLSAVGNDGFGSNGTLSNTGLTAGSNAISISGDEDVMVYSGSTTCNSTVSACAEMIANASNWTTEDGGGDQSQDAMIPDFPDDLPSSFGGTVLPVELTEFTASLVDRRVEVNWTTASELNNDFFEVQCSHDGENFMVIGTVDGHGDSDELINYGFTDRKPNAGMNYYRLRQVDHDGGFEYSPVRVVHVAPVVEQELNVFPNPSNGGFTLLLNHVDSPEVRLSLVDFSGKVIRQSNFDTSGPSLQIEFGKHLEPGLYVLMAETSNGTFVSRIVKE